MKSKEFIAIAYLAVCCLSVLCFTSCIEEFQPIIKSGPKSYLVVNGFINTKGRTRINLSRTVALTTNTPPPTEAKAQIYIEAENGPRYPLQEIKAGSYWSD
jgi:hypothetical protein